jgi:hypothetical protein
MKPANTIAENIVRMRQDNVFYAEQIQKNADLIEQLEPLAEWSEEPEVTIVVPDANTAVPEIENP